MDLKALTESELAALEQMIRRERSRRAAFAVKQTFFEAKDALFGLFSPRDGLRVED